MKANKPSDMALAIAKALYPDGLPNVSYCWDTPEKNEQCKQSHRDDKARIIDSVLLATPTQPARDEKG